jgi:competence protein ComEC
VFDRFLLIAPLVPFAVAATAGIIVDRLWAIPTSTSLVWVVGFFLIWCIAIQRRWALASGFLWLATLAIGAAYHHSWRYDYPADEIGNFTQSEPVLISIRATLKEEPSYRHSMANDPLATRPRDDYSLSRIAVNQVRLKHDWIPCSGNARLSVDGSLDGLHAGDQIEVSGWLAKPTGPLNPGESDFASRLQDERIRAEVRVLKSSAGLVRLEEGGWSIQRGLDTIKRWGRESLSREVSPGQANTAAALLLGDTQAMSTEEWDHYVRTGVIHVLAISGQHLAILAFFLWIVLRSLGLRNRPTAIVVAVILVGYAVMTGGRPSAMRAAAMTVAVSGGILLGKPALRANTFALAWMVVLILRPTDFFTPGFQLSFACVATLIWGIPYLFPERVPTPLEELIEESRSIPERILRGIVKAIGRAYLITLILGIATAPLTMYWQNLVAPAGLIIGPIAILLTTFALISGFIMLLLGPMAGVVPLLSWVTDRSLALCDDVVRMAERLPFSCWYTGTLPLWWVIGFYSLLIGWLIWTEVNRGQDTLRTNWFWPPLLLLLWVVGGVSYANLPPRESEEMRMSFLSVDHGGCVVIETPEGRVILYDTGSNNGPDVTRRHIAPYLWGRGIRRIDEVFLSHADLDHFNGLPSLLERFAVGQVTYSPSFADKPTAGVRKTLETLHSRGIATRQAYAGLRHRSGSVEMVVLHPPQEGPPGPENVRSLVLEVKHGSHSILLTGDLEGAGLEEVLAAELPGIDVLMTPHHGSGTDRLRELGIRTKPRLVVSCQGRGDQGKAATYYPGVPYWGTWPHGCITLKSHRTGLVAETFRSGERLVVSQGKDR